MNFCIWCGDDQDHECGLEACGNCCAMLGGLTVTDLDVYIWLADRVAHNFRKREIRLVDAEGMLIGLQETMEGKTKPLSEIKAKLEKAR